MPDLISDTHIDFYISIEQPEHKIRRLMTEFVDSILSVTTSDTLIIAGDIGHYNHQNKMMLEELQKHYKYIVIVLGNHDLYFVSINVRYKYKGDSMKRFNEMKKIVSDMENIHLLDGTTVEVDGAVYGGTMGWYDFSYAEKVLCDTLEGAKHEWRRLSNDSRLTGGLPLNTLEMFKQERYKLDKIIDQSDFIITHVGGEWSHCNPYHREDLSTSFYYFDGSYFYDRIKGKTWCFGHDHYRRDYEKYGCRFVNAALGYPDEYKGNKIINL